MNHTSAKGHVVPQDEDATVWVQAHQRRAAYHLPPKMLRFSWPKNTYRPQGLDTWLLRNQG